MTTPAVWAHRRFVYNSAVDWLGGIGRTDLTHPDSGLTSEDVLAAAYDLGWSPLSARFVVEPDAAMLTLVDSADDATECQIRRSLDDDQQLLDWMKSVFTKYMCADGQLPDMPPAGMTSALLYA